MADKKISALTASSTPLAGTEVLPIVQSGATVKVAVSDLTAGRAVSAASLALTTTPLPVTSGGTGTATAFTLGSVVFAGASGVYSQDNANLFYNSSNKLLGIGTASPGGALDVRGTGPVITAQQSAAGSAAYYVMDTTVETGGKRWRFGYSGATTFSNFSFLNVTDNVTALNLAANGIVTMSAYGAGAATFSASGVISSVSDETWKIKDGVPENPDKMLKKLEPGYWYYNEEKGKVFGKDRQLGFYAQNVNKAIGPEAAPPPEAITETDENGNETQTTKPWGYYDRSVLAVTVMALQKALERIDVLEARILNAR